jgi:hypothetical protein
MKTVVQMHVNREHRDDIEVFVTVGLEYDRGEYLEANHATNGYGAGYEGEILEVKAEEPIELTDEETEAAIDKAIEGI